MVVIGNFYKKYVVLYEQKINELKKQRKKNKTYLSFTLLFSITENSPNLKVHENKLMKVHAWRGLFVLIGVQGIGEYRSDSVRCRTNQRLFYGGTQPNTHRKNDSSGTEKSGTLGNVVCRTT